MKPTSKNLSAGATLLELGDLLGQRKAFGTVAGRCSAAEAAAIRRVREERLYEATRLSWKEFCPRHLGICRAQADRLIQHLDEFGPDYFEVAQLTRIPPEAYRAIAPSIKDGHIHWRNEAIALLPENSEKVAAAVSALRDAARPETRRAEPAEAADPIDAVKQRADEVVSEWTKLVSVRAGLAPERRQKLKNLIAQTRTELERLERQIWG